MAREFRAAGKDPEVELLELLHAARDARYPHDAERTAVIGDLRDVDQGPSHVWHHDAGVRRSLACIAAELRWLEEHAPKVLEGRWANVLRRALHRAARRQQRAL